MKHNISTALLTVCLMLGSGALADQQYLESTKVAPVSATFINDSGEEIAVRVRFRNNELYWTDWVHIPPGHSSLTITAKNPNDTLFGFAMLGEQASAALNIHDAQSTKGVPGIIYLLNSFHSDSGKQLDRLSTNAKIIIRESKIEISTELAKNVFWFGEINRE